MNKNALGILGICDDWYSNRGIRDFHKRENLNGQKYTISQMNFAKRCCSDDANLCEIVSVAPEHNGEAQAFIDTLLEENRFEVQYREQLEKVSAKGMAAAYILLRDAEYYKDAEGSLKVQGGSIRLNYVDAESVIPITVENKLVTECAFSSTNIVRGKKRTTLVIFTKDNGRYQAETVYFDDSGKEITEQTSVFQLGEVKPFAIMCNAEVNNLDNMEGYGLPKIYNAIPLLKAVDLCYHILFGDLDKGQKLVFINELLACINTDENGRPYLTEKQQELFVLLGNKLPEDKALVQEYNPEIRVGTITKTFELVLSLLSMSFGYGTRKYSFENGQIKTATEYIGERQDEMQELNRQRKQAVSYIEDIIHAAIWFSNQFHGTSYDVTEGLSVEFDDSYIEDRQTKLENMRADAISFGDIPILKVWYLSEKYNIPEEEAKKYIENIGDEPEEDED